MNKKTLMVTQAAVIAALYVVLIVIFRPLSYGPIQVRFAEILTVLPFFTPAAIPGVTIGCLLSGILTGASLPDIVFGSLATLIAAVISYRIRRYKYAVALPPILLNALIIPWILKYSYGLPDEIWFMSLTVGAGELIAAGLMGSLVLFALDKVKHIVFRTDLVVK